MRVKVKERERFKTLYADPPWNETGGGVKGGRRGADRRYSLMKSRDIIALGELIKPIMSENSHCYLWITNTFLCNGVGFECMRAWGYVPKTLITWAKETDPRKFGLGQYFRGQTEHVIFGVRGVCPYKVLDGKRQQSTTLLIEEKTTHSAKPESMMERIEKVSYPNYLELFASENRFLRPNWIYLGNKVTGNDIRVDLERLNIYD